MQRVTAVILLLTFTGFLASISVNYSGFLELINAGDPAENITMIPEESEESSYDEDPSETYYIGIWEWLVNENLQGSAPSTYRQAHVPWYCPEIPYSPPKVA